MTIDLKNVICPELDKDTKRFYAGLEARTVDLQNLEVFEIKVPGAGLSIVRYELQELQKLYARLGRYEDPAQQPMFVNRKQLPSALVAFANEPSDVIPVKIDTDQSIFEFYVEIVKRICKPGEQVTKYGETGSIDAMNILTLYERINGLGRFVAEAKVQEKPERLKMSLDELRKDLVRPKREAEIYANMRRVFGTHNLGDDRVADWFTKTMIEKTLDVEVMYIDLTRSYPRGEFPVAVPHESPLITPQRPAYPAGAIGFSQEPGSHARSCWGDR